MEARSAYDDKLASILRSAASVFAEKGYHSASIRDIASATGVSLSGLYYYVESKEELLFRIQEHCFQAILERQQADLREESSAEERLRRLIRNHLRFFVGNMQEMKVLSHEAEALSGEYRARIRKLKKAYTSLTRQVLEELVPDGSGLDLSTATFSLFGMMNWIYTWYRPARDPDVDRLASEMTHIFLHGLRSNRDVRRANDEAGEAAGAASPSVWRRT